MKQKLLSRILKLDSTLFPNLFNDDEFFNYVDKKHKGLIKNIENIEHLVLGSSHADYAFYPEYIENSYNLGLTSCDLYTSYNLFCNYKDGLVNLRNVILFFSVFDNGYSLIQTSEKYRVVAYKSFFNISYQKNDIIKTRHENKIIKQINNFKFSDINDVYKGYNKKTYFGINIKTEDRIRTHLKQNRREPDQIEWLNKLINSIQEMKLNLYIVLPPFRSDYRFMLPDKKELFQKLLSIEVQNVYLIDLYNSTNYNDSDFGDTDHLNEIGAKKLTRDLKQLIHL